MPRDGDLPAASCSVLRLIGAAMLMAQAGGGCGDVDPVVVAPGCPQGPLRGPLEWEQEPGNKLVDDFEDGNVMVVQVSGRDGSWVIGDDGTAPKPAAEASSRCAGRGSRAGHFTGGGFAEWGANWTAVFRQAGPIMAVPYDGSRWGGVSFWVAAGERATAPFELPAGITTMDVAWNGGVCSANCMDFYAKTVPITRSWQRVHLRFDDLKQGNWGDVQTPMRRDQLVGFIIWPNPTSSEFDIWLDDVRLEP
jgi:hypothetical protein